MDSREQAIKRVSDTIESTQYKNKYLRAFKNKKAKQPAISAFCCMCMGFEDCMSGIKGCKAYECPLWDHRPYK